MTTIAVQRLQDGVLTSADSATLTIVNSAGDTVVDAATVIASSVGVYSYEAIGLSGGKYTAIWTFSIVDQVDEIVSRVFQVEPAVTTTQGLTLADIERAIAARIGPYHRLRSTAGSGTNNLLVAKLRSITDLGDYEDVFLLRRGRTTADALVEDFVDDDRQRLVASFEAPTGTLVPDQSWSLAPIPNEWVELHYFDPEEELREIALQALRRCFFWETIEVAISDGASMRSVDLTASAWWLSNPDLVRGVEYVRSSGLPTRVPFFSASRQGGSVLLRTTLAGTGSLRVSALRSHDTLVNGVDSPGGPNDDDDLLYVEREYVARSGQIAAWMLFPAKMSPVATRGLALPMKQAADAFTIASMAYAKAPPEIVQNRFGGDDVLEDLQVGNA